MVKNVLMVFLFFVATAVGQDAEAYAGKPVREIKEEKVTKAATVTRRPTVESRSLDSLFEIVKRDSIAKLKKDSMDLAQALAADAMKPVQVKTVVTMADIKKADSLAAVVAADSMAVRQAERVIFNKQPNIPCSGRIDVDVRLDCLNFLIRNRLRSKPEVLDYLTILKKHCMDRCDMILIARVTLPDEQKFRAVAAYHHAREDFAKIQKLMEKL